MPFVDSYAKLSLLCRFVADPANATYCNHWSDCQCSQECWPIPPEITPGGEYTGICLCKSGNLMQGDSCDEPTSTAEVHHAHTYILVWVNHSCGCLLRYSLAWVSMNVHW